MVGDGLGLLPAFLATILVGRHSRNSANEPSGENEQFTAGGYIGKGPQLKRALLGTGLATPGAS
jgi:hypothetical protein